MKRRITILVSVVAIAAGTLVSILPAGSANAASLSCRGEIRSFAKIYANVQLSYWIICNRKVERIQVKAFIRELDRWSPQKIFSCENTDFCVAYELLADRPGSQLYTARPSGEFAPPATYVKDGSKLLVCNGLPVTGQLAMPCEAAGRYF